MKPREISILILLLVTVLALTMADLLKDWGQGVSMGHVVGEGSVLGISALGLGILLSAFQKSRRLSRQLSRDLHAVHADLAKWKQEAQAYIEGLSQTIDHQFDRWSLTAAEKEVGYLLLKGLSFKEIALARNTSERTVRQQSLDLYKKSQLSGRAEFAAFFLEDLFLPKSQDIKKPTF